MAKEISVQAHLELEPLRGGLTGNFEDCLNYLDWAINVYAGKGNLTATAKGKAVQDGIKTLNERFGWKISTHYLKQFCKQKNKNLHIAYILKLADCKVEPAKTSFKGGVVNGRRCIVPKIFDMVVLPEDYQCKMKRLDEFRVKCENVIKPQKDEPEFISIGDRKVMSLDSEPEDIKAILKLIVQAFREAFKQE